MAAELRGGLSFGLSGLHLLEPRRRRLRQSRPARSLSTLARVRACSRRTRARHGAPPREPWEYDSAFVDDFRRAVELKYSLMPYIYAQAQGIGRAKGWPMLRTLFFEYPDDPTSWLVEDEYMFGVEPARRSAVLGRATPSARLSAAGHVDRLPDRQVLRRRAVAGDRPRARFRSCFS